MITNLRLQNYRSFVDAQAKLSPFTLVIGANGAGKSNFTQAFHDLANPTVLPGRSSRAEFRRHINHTNLPQSLLFEFSDSNAVDTGVDYWFRDTSAIRDRIKLFKIDGDCVGRSEEIKLGAVGSDGSNIVSVLDGLKNGDREDLFDDIEAQLGKYIPTIEKLSSKISGKGRKSLQVREKDIKEPIPLAELSEGTRLLLTILTIVYQERAPQIIILEDIDYGLHPRLFSDLVTN